MSDSKKMFVFGSFTEEETRSLLMKQPAGNAEKPEGKIELQFGSLKFSAGETLRHSNGESSNLLFIKHELITSESTNGCNLNGDHRNAAEDGLPEISERPKENGITMNSANGSVEEFKMDSTDLTSTHFSAKKDVVLNGYKTLTYHVPEDATLDDGKQNSVEDSSPYAPIDTLKYANERFDIGTILPRGLINSGNLCFLNASLQGLLSCSPFVQLLQQLRHREIPKDGYPTLNAFSVFISEFDKPNSPNSQKRDSSILEIGGPLSPAMFEDVLRKFTPDVPNSVSGRLRQEDAQEFLSFIMDQMHDELLKLEGQPTGINGAKSSVVSTDDDDDEWETVGPKNKSAVTRTQSFVPSELNAIFGGQLKSVVRARGNKASATVQPFLLLHLDIYPPVVWTVEDALHAFSAPEYLEGYRAPAVGKAASVTAKKSVKIQALSRIMILHLMRFSYGSRGSTKLLKPVRFPLELVLGRELLASSSNESRRYELLATITHHGREPSRGHYTADARNSNGQWLRFDDSFVTAIDTNKVLHDQAYLLFYKQV